MGSAQSRCCSAAGRVPCEPARAGDGAGMLEAAQVRWGCREERLSVSTQEVVGPTRQQVGHSEWATCPAEPVFSAKVRGVSGGF